MDVRDHRWVIGDFCAEYGRVVATAIIQGESLIFFEKDGLVSMVPEELLSDIIRIKEEGRDGREKDVRDV